MAKKHDYEAASHWDDVLQSEFAKESDRAAVILTASLFENALGQLLRVRLVAAPSASDDLLDGANAPLSTFSAKISAAYRIGLISKRFCRDLHLIRQIRNQFAHNVGGCSFGETSVKSRVLELAKSSGFIERNARLRKNRFGQGTRGDFLMTASWMLWSINTDIEEGKPLEEAPEEWGYDVDIHESKSKPKEKNKGKEKRGLPAQAKATSKVEP